MPDRRRAALVALLLAPAFLGAVASRGVADRIGDEMGQALALLADLAARPPPPVRITPQLDGGALQIQPPGATSRPVREPTHPVRQRGRQKGRDLVTPRHGIRIARKVVLRLANGGVRPSGIPVPAEGPRPAGLLLGGVSSLGVGLQDGDVLTTAGGVPALSESEVVSVVIAARGRQVREIYGQFWRGSEPWSLIVEQPYVSGGTSDRGDESAPRRSDSLGKR